MFVVDKDNGEIFSLPAKEISPRDARNLSSELAIRILKLLSQKPMYPIEVARELKVHEQKVYYHIRNLEKAGIIKVVSKAEKQGALAKFYAVDKPALIIKLKELERTQKIPAATNEFLEPFVKDGQLDALIVVGSPDPHGPSKARSRDGYYGMDLALFLGTFLNYVPSFKVRLDTEARQEDLKQNLILIGGPVVNSVTGRINPKLPVRFERNAKWKVKSTVSGKVYDADEIGVIVKAKNPFDKDKCVLVVAGKRYSGTRAAIIAFLKGFNEIAKGNVHDRKVMAKVVEGVDLDSDGIIDDVEFRE